MARRPDRDDPLTGLRRLLRDLRRELGFCSGPFAGTIELALYRLPTRQREIIRQYDLAGKPRTSVQQELGLSSRQFFRDRRAALLKLSEYLLQGGRFLNRLPAATETHQCGIVVSEPQFVRRALARGLFNVGNIEGLYVLRELIEQVREPDANAGMLLDLAQAAADYQDDSVSTPHSFAEDLSDEVVSFEGPVAIVRGINRVTQNGRTVVLLRFTDVFVRSGGAWRAVAAQETPIRH